MVLTGTYNQCTDARLCVPTSRYPSDCSDTSDSSAIPSNRISHSKMQFGVQFAEHLIRTRIKTTYFRIFAVLC